MSKFTGAKVVVTHVLPSFGIGGIEVMIARFLSECPVDIEYRILVLSRKGAADVPLSSELKGNIKYIGRAYSPITYIHAAFVLLSCRDDVVVSSTWKAAIVICLAKLVGSIPRHISFTHRSTVAHRIDGYLRRWQVNHCARNVADSESAAIWVKEATNNADVTVIHPLFRPAKIVRHQDEHMKICFIGRLAPVKNIETVCKLVRKVASPGLSLTFQIYGPDGGSKAELDHWINSIDCAGLSVEYRGALAPESVQRVAASYDFIVACSHTEGFAMSIAEAMQVGVVPIVGSVGGPSKYCDEYNSIKMEDYSERSLDIAAKKVREIWHDNARYMAMSNAAINTFSTEKFFSTRYANILRISAMS